MAYLIDADVLIEAKNRHYGFDFCPAFWDWIDVAHQRAAVYSVDQVRDELMAGSDELADWAAARDATFFLRPEDSDLASLQAVAAWANGAGKEPAAVATFLSKADYYLVSQAHAGNHTVVTHEVHSSSPKYIKIPDACVGLVSSACRRFRCSGWSTRDSCSRNDG